MKATLEFDLIDPEQRLAHMRCIKALDMAIVLWEIKYNIFSEGNTQDIEEIREKIIDMLDAHGINMDELIN